MEVTRKFHLPVIFKAVVFAAVVVAGLLAHGHRSREVFLGNKIFFLDPDCYSRMTRVVQVLEGGGPSLRFHEFENAPFGTHPHTTAPVDWIIAAGAWALGTAGVPQAVDLAGAWISPVLGGVFLLGLAWWAWRRTFGLSALILGAFSPILVHGFSVGRPDHQSLLVLLVFAGLAAEWELWKSRGRMDGIPWGWVSAVSWGLALWVSLFEPLILLLVVLALRLFVCGKTAVLNVARPAGIFLGILLVAVLIDGLRMHPLPAETLEYFGRWGSQIGELQPAGWGTLAGWVGFMGLVSPFLLFFRGGRNRDRAFLAAGFLLVFLLGLSLWTSRWGYFTALGAVIFLPAALNTISWKPAAWTLFVVSLWPVAATWDRQLFPGGPAAERIAEQARENLLLRSTADQLAKLPRGPVLAPWWLSPALAYWSRQPMVAGSSHQSLPGTVDSARFYLAGDPETAMAILQKRGVVAVVFDDPSRILRNSSSLLGTPVQKPALVSRIYQRDVPAFLKPACHNAFFSVFVVEEP